MTFNKRPQTKTAAVFAIGLGVGMLFAFPIAAPLLGGVIPEGVASLWGAALGAFIAVAGAVWAAGAPLRIQRKNACALVHGILSPSVFFLDELAFIYGERSSPTFPGDDQEPDRLDAGQWREVATAAKIFLDAHHAIGKRLNRIDSALNFLGPKELAAVFSLESEMQSAAETVTELHIDASQIAPQIHGEHPSWGHRFALSQFLIHLRKDMEVLEAAGR